MSLPKEPLIKIPHYENNVTLIMANLVRSNPYGLTNHRSHFYMGYISVAVSLGLKEKGKEGFPHQGVLVFYFMLFLTRKESFNTLNLKAK